MLQRESDAALPRRQRSRCALGARRALRDAHARRSAARSCATTSACVLDGEGAECDARRPLPRRAARQHVDNHTRVDHAAPHCTSRELYKGVLDGRCARRLQRPHRRAPGRAEDRRAADEPNLLLSRRRRIDTKPQLEIFADDVKCSHGATIGQLDEDALFYLRSRGIGERRGARPADCALRGRGARRRLGATPLARGARRRCSLARLPRERAVSAAAGAAAPRFDVERGPRATSRSSRARCTASRSSTSTAPRPRRSRAR